VRTAAVGLQKAFPDQCFSSRFAMARALGLGFWQSFLVLVHAKSLTACFEERIVDRGSADAVAKLFGANIRVGENGKVYRSHRVELCGKEFEVLSYADVEFGTVEVDGQKFLRRNLSAYEREGLREQILQNNPSIKIENSSDGERFCLPGQSSSVKFRLSGLLLEYRDGSEELAQFEMPEQYYGQEAAGKIHVSMQLSGEQTDEQTGARPNFLNLTLDAKEYPLFLKNVPE
jgi:hypothetical protein